jgi:hypothetical protein
VLKLFLLQYFFISFLKGGELAVVFEREAVR